MVLLQAVRAQRNFVVKAETSTEGQVDVNEIVADLQEKVSGVAAEAAGKVLACAALPAHGELGLPARPFACQQPNSHPGGSLASCARLQGAGAPSRRAPPGRQSAPPARPGMP
jgi:hypothetical protein